MNREWPEPPGPDLSLEEIKRYASVRLAADYFTAIDEASGWPEELKLSPAEAWALAEDVYDREIVARAS
jgi:hypothetical protein